MLVTNHMEVSKKPEQNYTTALSKEEPGTKVQEQTTAQAADKEVEVSISDVNSRKSVLSDDELNVALEEACERPLICFLIFSEIASPAASSAALLMR